MRSDMTAQEFAGALGLLRWTAAAVAVDCGYSRQLGAAWERGDRPIPDAVSAWLDMRLVGFLDDPPARSGGRRGSKEKGLDETGR